MKYNLELKLVLRNKSANSKATNLKTTWQVWKCKLLYECIVKFYLYWFMAQFWRYMYFVVSDLTLYLTCYLHVTICHAVEVVPLGLSVSPRKTMWDVLVHELVPWHLHTSSASDQMKSCNVGVLVPLQLSLQQNNF